MVIFQDFIGASRIISLDSEPLMTTIGNAKIKREYFSNILNGMSFPDLSRHFFCL